MAIYFELFIIGAGLFGFSMMIPSYVMKIITLSLIAGTLAWAAATYGFVDCFISVRAGEYEDRNQFWSCVADHLPDTPSGDQ